MNCFFVTNHLSGLLDAQLADDARAEVEQHLKTCVGCRRHWQEMQALRATLQSVKIPEYNQTPRVKMRYILTRQKLKTPWTRFFIFSPFTLSLLSIITLSASIWAHRFPEPLSESLPQSMEEKHSAGSPTAARDSAEKDMPVPTVTPVVTETATPAPLPTPSAVPTLSPALRVVPSSTPPTTAAVAAAPSASPAVAPSVTEEEAVAVEKLPSVTLDVVIVNRETEADKIQEDFVKDCKKAKCRMPSGEKTIQLESQANHFTTTVVIEAEDFPKLVSRLAKWAEVSPSSLPPEAETQSNALLTLHITLKPKESL